MRTSSRVYDNQNWIEGGAVGNKTGDCFAIGRNTLEK
jgi:hypothetical protein